MKLKHRALTLLLSITMLLTFMPALAFAVPEEGVEAKSAGKMSGIKNFDNDEYRFIEKEDEEVMLEEKGEGFTATLTVPLKQGVAEGLSFTWYSGTWVDAQSGEEDGHWNWDKEEAAGNTANYEVSKAGYYKCVISDNNNTEECYFDVCEPSKYFTKWHEAVEFEGDPVELTVPLREDAPADLSFTWYKAGYADPDSIIENETIKTYTAKEPGYYTCKAVSETDGDDAAEEFTFYVYDPYEDDDDDDSWQELFIEYNKTLIINVEDYYKLTGGETFKWYTGEWIEDEQNEDGGEYTWSEIESADKSSYTVKAPCFVKCTVTSGESSQDVCFEVRYNTESYSWEVIDRNADAVYSTHDDRDLVVDFTQLDEYGEETWTFPEKDDTVTITTNGTESVYTFVEVEKDGETFLELESEDSEAYPVDYEFFLNGDKVQFNVWSDDYQYDHANKKVKVQFDVLKNINAEVKSDIESIIFEPAKIELYSENIKDRDDDGHVFYSFQKRGKITEDGETEDICWIKGDKVTVKFVGKDPVTYNYNDQEGRFIYIDGDNNENYFYIYPDYYGLSPGNNTIKLWSHGKSATINVYMDTPAARNERTLQAEWNGVLSASIPKTKGIKASAAKKKVKVSWSKEKNKKKLKKFDKVEIQVCPDKNFARLNTIRKVVSKKKKNVTIKKLTSKKNYWVRVRYVKGSGASKLVSKWSKPKKVKIK